MKAGHPIGFLLPLLWMSASCTDGHSPANVHVVRDSSGIQIVESKGPRWSPGEPWQVSAEPVTVIGDESRGGQPLYRVNSAELLDGGRFLIASSGSNQVYITDSRGEVVLVFGGTGDGPGEFQRLRFAQRVRGDSILAWDSRARRGTVFDEEGELIRTIPFPAEAFGHRFPEAVGAFPDGTLLARSGSDSNPLQRGYASFHYLTMSPDGDPVAEIGELPSMACGAVDSCFVGWFGPLAAQALGDDAFYHGYPDRYEVSQYGLDGRLRRILRREAERISLSLAALEPYERYVIDSSDRVTEEDWNRALQQHDMPQTMPAFSPSMVVDEGNHLWVRGYGGVTAAFHPFVDVPPFHPTAFVPWSVFDPQGVFEGVVRVPSRLRVLEIGDDYLLGIHTDDLGVETVRMYSLDRS